MRTYILIILCSILIASCDNTNKEENVTGHSDTMTLKEESNVSQTKQERTNWDSVDFASPVVQYDEIKSKDIEVRANGDYSIYTIEENILFDFDKAEIRPQGQQKLDEIITSIKKRYPEGELALYGFTDSIGSKEYNKELSEDRAEAVEQYLEQKGNIEDDRLNTHARGEQNPTATNQTAQGRQQNRRVNIVVMGNEG